MEGDGAFFEAGEVGFDFDVREPEAEAVGGGVDVGELGVEGVVKLLVEEFLVEGAGGVGDEDDALEVVDADEEVELGAGGVVEVLGGGRGGVEPGRAAGDGEAVVAGDAEVFLAKFVEGFAESAVGAIDGQSVDALGVPEVGGGEDGFFDVCGGV